MRNQRKCQSFSTYELKTTQDTCANLHKIYDQDRHRRIKRSPWFGSTEIYAVMIREWHTWLDLSSVLRLINITAAQHENTRKLRKLRSCDHHAQACGIETTDLLNTGCALYSLTYRDSRRGSQAEPGD